METKTALKTSKVLLLDQHLSDLYSAKSYHELAKITETVILKNYQCEKYCIAFLKNSVPEEEMKTQLYNELKTNEHHNSYFEFLPLALYPNDLISQSFWIDFLHSSEVQNKMIFPVQIFKNDQTSETVQTQSSISEYASELLVPIQFGQEIIGVIVLLNSVPKSYSNFDSLLIKIMARVLATIAQNISATKTKEKALKEANLRSKFLSNMSHEIRTPMNGVLGMLELLSLSKLDKNQKSQIKTISASAHSLLTILNDILDYSKMEEGKFEIHKSWVNLYECAHISVQTFASMALEKGIDIHFNFTPAMDYEVFIDPVRFRQVLNNIISNAVKFTKQGYVKIEIKHEYKDGFGNLWVSVSDTGQGISNSALGKIFQPWEQGEGDSVKKSGGTGLGLSISKTLVDLMNGSIFVCSEVGLGTTFNIKIPTAHKVGELRTIVENSKTKPKLALNKNESNLESYDFNKNLILIAEDNPVNQEVVGMMLNSLNINFKIVENGKAALEELSNDNYSLILLDCEMPVMDGFETTRRIRSMEAGSYSASLPIVALTALAFDNEKSRCLESGMDDILTKPLSLSSLKEKLSLYINLPKEASLDKSRAS